MQTVLSKRTLEALVFDLRMRIQQYDHYPLNTTYEQELRDWRKAADDYEAELHRRRQGTS